ncbi:MAG: hypothetical protein CMC31_05915 [Flavobacteriaceae bacterium]|nr:hypothetical protein [Flavobacteriaceae bacterium]|tara:strand:+ start:1021 stop:1734 length:714 start_codon:yes stop_codon:yes gene_type:complete
MKDQLKKFPKISGPLRSFYNMYFGEKEIKPIFKLLKVEKKKYVFFDVGANYGVYSFLFSKNSIFSYIFEPVSECIEYIRKGYRYKNIVMVNKAVSNSNQSKTLNMPIENGNIVFGRSSIQNNYKNVNQREVKCTKLDNYIDEVKQYNPRIIFIKIDVEGHENQVIEGAINLISQNQTLLLVEIEKRHNTEYINVFNKLKELNFKGYIYENKQLIEINLTTKLEEIMNNNNNFIFKNY